MRTIQIILVLIIALLCVGCANFPTSYSRIESDKIRLLDFIYEPAEAAPGDTVQLTAVFAGKPVSHEQLTWEMSRKMIINEYYVVAALDTVPLQLTLVDTIFSEKTNCVSFTFVIPENTISESPIVPDRWYTTLPDYFQGKVPAALRSLSKQHILSMLDNWSSMATLDSLLLDEQTATMLPALLQCFTVPIRIYCSIEHGHTIMSTYSVRYNSRFVAFPQLHVPVNHNPVIDSVGIYTVKKDVLVDFNPDDCDYTFSYHTLDSDTNIITFVKGYTYFIAAFTGNRDTTLSIDAAMGASVPLPEFHRTQWYLQHNNKEIKDMPASDLMDIHSGNLIEKLQPPEDKTNKSCTAWLEVSDQFYNEYYRPIGSTLKEFYFQFEFK